MAKWNGTINLTSLTVDPATDESIDKLIVEPVVAAKHVKPSDELLIDLGSGGGSPAIPLKIAAPWLRVTMVESKGRKAAFLRDACRQLELTGTEVENIRFEELAGRPSFSQSDLVSVRAVRADRSLWDLVLAMLKLGGRTLGNNIVG